MTAAFSYPTQQAYRHGPAGYADYGAYRPWLRDEYCFRCVYCLRREQWGLVTGEFDLDHFIPQSLDRERANDYDNLVYSCRACNALKSSKRIGDVRTFLTHSHVRVDDEGNIQGLSHEASALLIELGMNSESYRRWRRMWNRVVQLAATVDADLYKNLMGFPTDLPDLERLRPPAGNSRPAGIAESFFARRRRGDLPETY